MEEYARVSLDPKEAENNYKFEEFTTHISKLSM
ncbi:hypothetical protein OnM2_107023 [Erysiphe neolycopersici]|uniref:Uncharacterized protein n=1 Tax=Erysiphe neolycopersici TaxID=212602 RepID=A0A420H757_9PEZI|nr:hypothetical protein OnM2_107023 [Erysiphe neolycopersici]